MLEPGTHVDSWWGHYQSAHIVRIARHLGWQPEPMTIQGSPHEQTQTQANDWVDELAAHYIDHGDSGIDPELWHDIVQEAEDWVNDNHTPEDHYFGHHPDIGDIGVWPIEDWE